VGPSDYDSTRSAYQQAKRRKSQSEKEELNRSRRSSKSRLAEDHLPESYADLAKRVYKMADKEGWSQQKIFELLKDPAKLVKTMEHVTLISEFCSENWKVSRSRWTQWWSA